VAEDADVIIVGDSSSDEYGRPSSHYSVSDSSGSPARFVTVVFLPLLLPLRPMKCMLQELYCVQSGETRVS